jgi:hypothetical protein
MCRFSWLRSRKGSGFGPYSRRIPPAAPADRPPWRARRRRLRVCRSCSGGRPKQRSRLWSVALDAFARMSWKEKASAAQCGQERRQRLGDQRHVQNPAATAHGSRRFGYATCRSSRRQGLWARLFILTRGRNLDIALCMDGPLTGRLYALSSDQWRQMRGQGQLQGANWELELFNLSRSSRELKHPITHGHIWDIGWFGNCTPHSGTNRLVWRTPT